MFKATGIGRTWLAAFAAGIVVLAGVRDASAHCDTVDGPVIGAAQAALEAGDVNLVLVWVQPDDEAAIREEFARARADRRAGGAVGEAADRRFFEALVRIHRAGEGAPYTGIKAAGTEVDSAVAAADRSLASGSVEPVRSLLASAVSAGIEKHYEEVVERRDYDRGDVAAGREYVAAYVGFTHYAEGLYGLATAASVHHEGGGEGHGAAHHAEGSAHDGHSSHTAHLSWILAGVMGLVVVGETGWIAWRRPRKAEKSAKS